MPVRLSLAFLLLALTCSAETSRAETALTDDIVSHYTAVSASQKDSLNGATMEVKIEASLPKLRKRGLMSAVRHISRLGRITYDALHFEGDNTVKSNVIARYLAAEVEGQQKPAAELAVSPENYKFHYKGTADNNGREAHVLHVTPRKKKVGLFTGDVWIDSQTYLKVREEGKFVKSPSIFLKKVQFVRLYDIKDGVAVPRFVQSVVDTRLVGAAELKIDFSNVALNVEHITATEVDAQ